MLMGRIADEWKSREMGIDGLVESNRSGGVAAKNINVYKVAIDTEKKQSRKHFYFIFHCSLTFSCNMKWLKTLNTVYSSKSVMAAYLQGKTPPHRKG